MNETLTDSCARLGCPHELRCHRCGSAEGVEKRFVVDNTWASVAGSTPKLTGHWTHSCQPCHEEWHEMLRGF